MRFLLPFVFFYFFSLGIHAKEYFVSTNGYDSNSGTIKDPFGTVAHASLQVKPGDTVTIRGGTYYLEKQFRPRGGEQGKWVLYRSMPGEKAILDGSRILKVFDGKTDQLFSRTTQGIVQIEKVSYVRFENIGVCNSRAAGFIVRGPDTKQVELEGCSSDRSYNSGIGLWYADSVKVHHCEVIHANDPDYRNEEVPMPREAPHEAISICGARFFEVSFNHVHHCYKEGIDCKEVSCHGVIHNNYVHDLPRQAYYVDAWFGLLEDVELYENKAHDCAWGFAISVEGKGSEVRNIRFHHNVIYNMKAAGVLFGIWGDNNLRSDIHIYNNTFYKCGSPRWFSGGVGSIDILSKNFKDVYIYRNICDKGWDYEMGFSFTPQEVEQAIKKLNFIAEENLFESSKNRPSRTGQFDYHVYEYLPPGNTIGAPLYKNELEYDLTPEIIPPIKKGFSKWKYEPSPWYGAIKPIDSPQLPVDANGWSIIKTSPDSKVIYVSNSEGNDRNDGMSPQTAVSTIEKAKQLVRDGYPDHILLKRGDSWVLGDGLETFYSGRNALEPMVVSYYGENGDRPLIKMENSFVHIQDEERSHLAFVGLELYAYKHDPNSPDYESERGFSGISFINAGGENILIEDCKFNYMAMGAYTSGKEKKLKNFKFRRNIIIHSWAGDSYHIHELRTRVQGMYISGVDGILIEENLFDHNGWDEQIEGAGATMYNHNIYMSELNPNPERIIIHNNILARGSAHGLQLRSGGFVEDNLFVRNAINLNLGYHVSTSIKGAFAVVENNVFQEVRLMDSLNTDYPRTNAVRGIGEITIPSFIANNIFSNCLNEAQFGIDTYNDKWGFGGQLQQINNIVYKWTNKNDRPDPQWPHPERTLAEYHYSLGKESSTIAFLLEARKRPLKTWWFDYSAHAVNEYFRAGFGLPSVNIKTRNIDFH